MRKAVIDLHTQDDETKLRQAVEAIGLTVGAVFDSPEPAVSGRPKIDPSKEAAIRAELIVGGGSGIRKIASLYKVGVSVVQRINEGLTK